jgi:hypothetical protein
MLAGILGAILVVLSWLVGVGERLQDLERKVELLERVEAGETSEAVICGDC